MFETVEDATQFINGQLLARGYLKTGNSLKIDGAPDDARLVINTIHKLLKAVQSKDQQLTEAQTKLQRLQKAVPEPQPRPTTPREPPREPPKRPTPNKIVKNKDKSLRKLYKVRLNGLQSTIDELKDRFHRERRSTDITWQAHQEITTQTNPQIQEDFSDQLTQLLARESQQYEFDKELQKFLANVNRFTYSCAVLGIPDIDLQPQPPHTFDYFKSHEKAELVECITDWYEIVDISRRPVRIDHEP